MQISGLTASNTFSATDVLAIEVNENGTNKTYKLTGATLATALASIGSYLKTTDVVDNLTSTVTDQPLSAAQGKALNDNLAWKNAGSATALNQDVSFPISAKELYVEVSIQNSNSYVYSFYIVLTGSRYYFDGYYSSAADNGSAVVQVTSQAAIRVVTLQYKGAEQTTLAMNVKYR